MKSRFDEGGGVMSQFLKFDLGSNAHIVSYDL